MKRIVLYEHKCKRCEKKFRSESETPLRCGRCKSPYWNIPRKKEVRAEVA